MKNMILKLEEQMDKMKISLSTRNTLYQALGVEDYIWNLYEMLKDNEILNEEELIEKAHQLSQEEYKKLGLAPVENIFEKELSL